MVLFVAYGGGHVAMLAAVAKALRDAGRRFTFLGLTTARAYLDRLGIPSIGFKDLPGAESPEVQTWGERLARELPPGDIVAHDESVAYLGLCFRDLVESYGEGQAMTLYRREGRQAFLPVTTMRGAIDMLRPDVLVATNSPRAERAAIVAAGQLGVPAICVVDLFILHEAKWIGQPAYARRVCVLNDHVRQRLLDYGRSPDEVIVTGNPAFDRLTTPETVHAGVRLRRARGWNDDLITVLWASQIEAARHPFTDRVGDPSLPRRIERYLRDFVAENPGYRLVVRYHPSEREVFIRQPFVEFSPTSEDIAALLHAVDVVVVTASTVGLEASLAGRPVISVDDSVITADVPYSAMGISIGVPKLECLGPALGRLAGSHRPVSQSTGAALRTGTSATERVIQVINSLL